MAYWQILQLAKAIKPLETMIASCCHLPITKMNITTPKKRLISDSQFSIDILDNEDIKIRSLHSFDIFMPILWVTAEVLLPIAINLVSNFIYDKMKGREHEEANVELSFIVERNNEKKMLHYKGPASEFEKEFKAIDLSEL